ncbi:hypothetical protein D7V94_09770 [Parablautia intestinalis]|uniref:Uncharacterized protein n=1 Tax=Parablautia intestinalis TaxID=2320100 RepID=A0A3A9AVK4_9FIRM|nr:hypothetical protein D7V94_09770 [Parablautia intestinalis]
MDLSAWICLRGFAHRDIRRLLLILLSSDKKYREQKKILSPPAVPVTYQKTFIYFNALSKKR